MKSNSVIYARYSSHSQNEQSIETQVEICKSYAKKNNLKIVQVYEDKAKSGTNDNREAFQQMLSDSSNKGFSHVIVYNLSRFARNSYESVNEKFNFIISNPPIRVGKSILYGILMDAKEYLKPGGELWIVIHKDQGAKTVMKDLEKEYDVTLVTKNKGFYIIRCINN